MSKKLLITDTHLGMYSDSDAWLDIVLNFYKYIIKYCYKNDIKEIVHLGDFFDNRKSLNTKTQHIAHRIAKVLTVKEDLHTYIIVGNHDCYYKNTIHPNTLELFKEYDHITVVDDIMKVDNILLVPWGMIPEETQDAKYCFGHFAIKGFHMNDSYKCKDGIDQIKFKDFERVLSGHFHTPSSNSNITYLGAPYGQTFHDAGGVRGFHIFDDGKLKFVEYEDAPKFVKIYTTSEPLNPDEITGNVVKVVFTKDFGTTRNQEIIDNIIEHKPFLYSVSFANMEEGDEVSEGEVAYLDSKEKIVDQYISEQTYPTNIKIDTLKTMFKKMLKEAGVSKSDIKVADGTKIECNEIGFQNFLSFGSRWQDVPLKKGVNFVTGYDKDRGKSNGAGKSSFLETIPFALFGRTARDIKQTQIINWKNKKNCKVVFRFKINDDLYEIERSLKPNKLLIYKNGDIIDQDAHKSDYQSMFENIFGMDVKMFMSLVHSNVNNTASIVSMKKAEKRVFLERMFGLEIYSEMNKISNEKLRGVENKKYKAETDIESFNEKIKTANDLIENFRKEINSKKYITDELESVKEEFQKISDEYPDIEDDIQKCFDEIQKEKDDFNKITISFEKWKANKESILSQIKKKIKDIDDQEEQRKINQETEVKINSIIERVGSIDVINEKIKKLDEEYKIEEEKLESKRIEVSDIEKEIIDIEADLRNINKSLDLLSDGKCPVCGQDTSDPKGHYEDEKKELNERLSLKKKELKKTKDERFSLGEYTSDIRHKKSLLQDAKDRIYLLQGKIKNVADAEEKDDLVKEKAEISKAIEKKESGYKKKEIDVNDRIKSLQSKWTDLKHIHNKIKAKEDEYKILVSQVNEVVKHVESLKGMIKEQEKSIENTEMDIHNVKTNVIRLNNIADYLNEIKNILKDENIKQYTIKQIMPYLNKQVNHYLSEVNYGFYVSIDKWLDVDIKGPGIRDASYDNLSGGERRGIDIAIQLSLLDIARTQSGCFPDILIFDELLDSSIDGVGMEQLMKIIKVKQKETDDKIFIISHRQEIDAELIDNEYKVEKENGFSRVII